MVSSSSAFIERQVPCCTHLLLEQQPSAGRCRGRLHNTLQQIRSLQLMLAWTLCRNKGLVLEILHETTGISDIIWRPSASMLREEGIDVAPAPEADTANQQVLHATTGQCRLAVGSVTSFLCLRVTSVFMSSRFTVSCRRPWMSWKMASDTLQLPGVRRQVLTNAQHHALVPPTRQECYAGNIFDAE